jgi:hypothetical protein
MNKLNIETVNDAEIIKHYEVVSLSSAPSSSDIPDEGFMYVWKDFENDVFKIKMKDSSGKVHSISEKLEVNEENDLLTYTEDDFTKIDDKMYLTIDSLKPIANTYIETLSGTNMYDLNKDFDISLDLNLNETTLKLDTIQLNGKKFLVQFASNKNIIENGNLYITENVNVDESEFMKKIVSTIMLLEN